MRRVLILRPDARDERVGLFLGKSPGDMGDKAGTVDDALASFATVV